MRYHRMIDSQLSESSQSHQRGDYSSQNASANPVRIANYAADLLLNDLEEVIENWEKENQVLNLDDKGDHYYANHNEDE